MLSAAGLGDVEAFEQLCADQRLEWRTPFGAELLVRAARGGHWEMVQAMHRGGADIDAQDELGCTALMHAAQAGHPAIVSGLHALGASVEVRAKDGSTALMLAASSGNLDIVERLIAGGAAFDAVDDLGNTAMMHAAGRGQWIALEMLARGGADLHAVSHGGATVGHYVLAAMREAEIALDARNAEGQTPAMGLAQQGLNTALQVFLAAGADIHAVDHHGDSVLVYAVRAHNLPAIDLLRSRGASFHVLNHEGMTPFALLLQHVPQAMTDTALQGNHGEPALIRAAQLGLWSAAEVLILMGADIDAVDGAGNSALMHAAMRGHGPVLRMLLEMGADCTLRNHCGADALRLAAAAGHASEETALADAAAQMLRQAALAAEQDLSADLPLYCAVPPQAYAGADDADDTAVTVEGLRVELVWPEGPHAGGLLSMIA